MEISEDALSLVKSVGLPGLVEGETLSPSEALSLLPLAGLNKIPLLFLESLRESTRHPSLEAQLSRYRDKHGKASDLIAIASNMLEGSEMRYTIFKTLKPFPYTPADIDILLWSSRNLSRAAQILEKKGLKPLDADFHGLTMLSIDHDVNVDLTTEVAVSSLIYLDKTLLFNYPTQVEVNGFKVQTLKPYAELVTTAAHCMYKEQMYNLSDYYTLALSSDYYQEALKLAESLHVEFALETALKLTHDITINAFGSNNILTRRLENSLKSADPNTMIETSNRLDLPIKYPPKILLKALSKKILEDPVSRNSLPKALKSTLQPNFIHKLLEHITRKAY